MTTANALTATDSRHLERQAQTLPPAGSHVPAVGTVRRLQALVAAGHSRTDVARRLAVTAATLTRLTDPDTNQVTAATAAAVAVLFTQLELVPGTSSRAIREGRSNGWPLPLQWDEDAIDDPATTVTRSATARTHCGKPRFAQTYAELRYQLGLTDTEILRRMRIDPKSFIRQKDRNRDLIESERAALETHLAEAS